MRGRAAPQADAIGGGGRAASGSGGRSVSRPTRRGEPRVLYGREEAEDSRWRCGLVWSMFVDGGIPSSMDVATGREYDELTEGERHQELGAEVLASQAATHWGTKENPVKVLSAVDHRIVGCTGEKCSSIHENGVLWWRLDAGAPHECPCGQVFQLVDRPHGLDQH